MRNAGLDELQVEINIGRRNSDLRYVDDTTLKAESEVKLKSLLMRVKEESERADLKLKKNQKQTNKKKKTKLRSWHLVPSLHGK